MTRAYLRDLLRANRRPVVLTIISAVLLVAYFILVRAMAHGHVAHVLLGAGNGSIPGGAAAIAIGLVVVRFVLVVFAPGLMLAAIAELAAYVLVGPRRDTPDDDLDLGGDL
ncbi:MAG: hypothetical protein KIT84_41475 [Labilithrix sp.]|nr:hypothetical protein [Labilithrix sp.]MCW5817543.1 hypothetical protein [Labilithrix sp.]